MPRYIDADVLLNNTDGMEHVKYSQEYGHVVPVCDIVYAPTVDAVEVVRCKDCKHRGYIVKDRRGYEWIEYEETSHCPLQCYDDDYYNRLSEDDFFCADGERREDG